jgi:hypothetical protein
MTELIVTILFLSIQTLLMWRQNLLFKEQNRIMNQQLAHDTGAGVGYYYSKFIWPMITMAALAVLSRAAVGTWMYGRV